MTDQETKSVEKKVTKPAKTVKASKGVEKLRITVRAYDHRLLDQSVKLIVDTATKLGAVVRGPIPLPTDIRKYTVMRAAFIDKDAREQFEMRTHKRLIDIMEPNPKIIEALTNLDLASGVSIQVKMV